MLAILGWNPDAPHKKRVELNTNHAIHTTGDGSWGRCHLLS